MSSKLHIDELYKKTQSGLSSDEMVLDVREDDEWVEGHIAGAKHVPIDLIEEDVKKYASELAKYKKVYVHCMGGGRAGRATEALTKAGHPGVVHIAESGMRHWLEKKYPVLKGK